jgi:hypothetical protein
LIQKYIYSCMDEVERVHLHEKVGTVLERLYEIQHEDKPVSEIATQLAWPFRKRRFTIKRYITYNRLGKWPYNCLHIKKGLHT